MRKADAFTLIELLVVIAVIALLLAILMPALSKAKDHAMGAACKGNLKNYTIAIVMYLDDNDGKFPDPRKCYFTQMTAFPAESGLSSYIHVRWCNGEMNLRNHPEYAGPFFRYMGDARAFICPAYKRMTSISSEDHFYQADAGNIRLYEPWYNYTMNAYLGSEDGAGVNKSRVRKVSEVKHPAATFSFTEESARVDTAYNVSGLNDTFMVPGDDAMVDGWLSQVGGNPRFVEPGPQGVGAFWDVIAGFHHAPSGDKLGGKGNCAFLDGHVSAHARAETFPLAWPR